MIYVSDIIIAIFYFFLRFVPNIDQLVNYSNFCIMVIKCYKNKNTRVVEPCFVYQKLYTGLVVGSLHFADFVIFQVETFWLSMPSDCGWCTYSMGRFPCRLTRSRTFSYDWLHKWFFYLQLHHHNLWMIQIWLLVNYCCL